MEWHMAAICAGASAFIRKASSLSDSALSTAVYAAALISAKGLSAYIVLRSEPIWSIGNSLRVLNSNCVEGNWSAISCRQRPNWPLAPVTRITFLLLDVRFTMYGMRFWVEPLYVQREFSASTFLYHAMTHNKWLNDLMIQWLMNFDYQSQTPISPAHHFVSKLSFEISK